MKKQSQIEKALAGPTPDQLQVVSLGRELPESIVQTTKQVTVRGKLVRHIYRIAIDWQIEPAHEICEACGDHDPAKRRQIVFVWENGRFKKVDYPQSNLIRSLKRGIEYLKEQANVD